ncbi:MAG: hypothetical protein CVV27_03645 [Candidatus Melainabacteria bacterium HGW-Melainabacteria-1]|nr:MAG: hypothetical protein CVV27_03645 [Candidatus Melainabacteria bacterium HGW-Melainabacteria-1]
MQQWQELAQQLAPELALSYDQVRMTVERKTRQNLIPAWIAYAKDRQQPTDARQMTVMQLGQIFARTDLGYQPEFKQALELFELWREPVIETLCELMRDPAYMIRGNAIYSLAKLYAYDKVDLIREATSDKHSFVRWSALETLKQWRVPVTQDKSSAQDQVTALAAQLKQRDGGVRLEAVKNLLVLYQKTRYAPALELSLSQLKQDRAGYVRAEIAETLGHEFKLPEVIPALIASAREDRHARESALWALIRLGEHFEVSAEVFIESLSDPAWQAVSAAAQGIQILRFQQGIPALREALLSNRDMYHKSTACAEALGSFGRLAGDAAPDLLSFYHEARQSRELADALIMAYGKVSGPEAIPELLSILNFEHTRSDVRQSVVQALKQLGWQGEEFIFGQTAQD